MEIITWESLQERRYVEDREVDFPPPIWTYMVNDYQYPVASKGELVIITGTQKTRKTFYVLCQLGAALSGMKILGSNLILPPTRNVVYIDTEQPMHRFYKVQNRLKRIISMDHFPDNYHAFNLRHLNVGMRCAAIEIILGNIPNIDILVIDGLVDICENFMDPKESQATMSQVLKWSDTTQALTFGILHTTKTGEYVRGHLGTEAQNKADAVIETSKKRDDPYTKVVVRDHRDKGFPTFEFRQNEFGDPILKHEEKQDDDNN